MSVAGKRVFQNLADTLVAEKSDIQPSYAASIRSDASAILEALVAELPEEVVLAALARQGFDAPAYRTTLRGLAELAHSRRVERNAGGRAPETEPMSAPDQGRG